MLENNEENTHASLHDVLSTETEHKNQSTTTSKAWNFDADAVIIEEEAETTEPGTGSKKGTVTNEKDKELIRKASAETATASMDAMIDLVGGIVISVKCKKRFTPDEWDKAREIQDKPIETLPPDDQALLKKFNREILKKSEKLKELPFDDRDTTRLTAIFYNYFKITGKELSPEFLLVMGIGSILVDKAAVVFMD